MEEPPSVAPNKRVRIGILADIHGNHVALRSVLSSLQGRVDRLLFLGDLVGYYPFVNECVDLLAGWDVSGVVGNHDQIFLRCLDTGDRPDEKYCARYGPALGDALCSASLEVRSFLGGLSAAGMLRYESLSMELFHGSPWDPLEGRVYPDFSEWSDFDSCRSEFVLLGHTHYQLYMERPGQKIVNSGSVGQARDKSGKACYAELEIPSGEFTLCNVPYDIEPIIAWARQCHPKPPYLVSVLTR